MARGTRIGTSKAHAIACRFVPCLLLVLFSLVIPAAPASAGAHHMPVEFVSSPTDDHSDHSDCDHGLAGMTGHCHTTSSCFAQAAPATVSLDLQTAGHAKAVSQDDVTSRSPQPNLRPPKRSIQA